MSGFTCFSPLFAFMHSKLGQLPPHLFQAHLLAIIHRPIVAVPVNDLDG